MAKKYQDFDEPEQDGVFDQILTIVSRRKKAFAVASVSIAVVLLGFIVWGTYPDSADQQGSIPIVRADAGPYKTPPENPGGMEIPYRDSTIFSNTDSDQTTENILAPDVTEQPMPKSELFAGLNTESAAPPPAPSAQPSAEAPIGSPPVSGQNDISTDTTQALVDEAIGTPPSVSAVTETPQVAPDSALASAVLAKPDPVVAPPAMEEKEKAKAKTPASDIAKTEPAAGAVAAKAITPGNFYVQLASVRSQSGAGSEWKKLQAKHTSLSGLDYRTQEANLGEKGVFYRIQAGPMSKDSAGDLCAGIKRAGGSCLVVSK